MSGHTERYHNIESDLWSREAGPYRHDRMLNQCECAVFESANTSMYFSNQTNRMHPPELLRGMRSRKLRSHLESTVDNYMLSPRSDSEHDRPM